MSKFVLFALIGLSVLASSTQALAQEVVVKRCVGWNPANYVELIKIIRADHVIYRVDGQGVLVDFNTYSEANDLFTRECATLNSGV